MIYERRNKTLCKASISISTLLDFVRLLQMKREKEKNYGIIWILPSFLELIQSNHVGSVFTTFFHEICGDFDFIPSRWFDGWGSWFVRRAWIN